MTKKHYIKKDGDVYYYGDIVTFDGHPYPEYIRIMKLTEAQVSAMLPDETIELIGNWDAKGYVGTSEGTGACCGCGCCSL